MGRRYGRATERQRSSGLAVVGALVGAFWIDLLHSAVRRAIVTGVMATPTILD